MFQERLLSPRVIYWASDQVFWQCSSLHACEAYPTGCPVNTPFVIPSDFPSSQPTLDRHCISSQPQLHVRRAWRSIVHNYSTCRLTYPDLDKLPALAGVAEQFAHLFDDDYIAGLFRRQLPETLIWMVAEIPPRKTHPSSSPYRCPSWTWAKLNIAVSLPPNYDDNKRLADVIDTELELHDPANAFGRLRSAKLVLHGWTTPVRWDLPPMLIDTAGETYPHEDLWRNRCLVHADILGPNVYAEFISFDYTEYGYEAQESVFFMPITAWGNCWVKGLMLRKLERDGHQVYERIGTALLSSNSRTPGQLEIVKRFEKLAKQDVVLI